MKTNEESLRSIIILNTSAIEWDYMQSLKG
uniref:Uncharacterized protein n=1 Tax=Rhizophora mucronata TaxID=61149 RepID=A0A2P2QHK4_RHIMU